MATGMLPLAATRASAAERERAPTERLRAQICVVGGGSGGTGAALAAARADASVVLLERESVLGGTATCALVNVWRPGIGGYGIPYDLYHCMNKDPLGVTVPPGADPDTFYAQSQIGPRLVNGANHKSGKNVGFEPRAMDYAVRSLLEATGCCRTLLSTTFCRAYVENDTVKAVEAWHHGQRLIIEADVFIDCTADGDLCADAGCAFHLGEDPKSLYQEPHAPDKAQLILNGMTLCYRITDTGVSQKPYLPTDIDKDKVSISACFDPMPNGDIIVNALAMVKGNALLHTEHSQLMWEAHRKVLAHFYKLQQLPPDDRWASRTRGKGWGTWAISAIAPRLGVRETRRMVTEYVLNENDCVGGLSQQSHSDIVALADHHIDIHGSNRIPYTFPKEAFGVPYRCLLPKGLKNLLVASRSAGFSHIAASAVRLQRSLMTLGQAAGNAAAMAATQRIGVNQIDIKDLQARLRTQKVEIAERI